MLNSSKRTLLRLIARTNSRAALPIAKRHISFSPILREKSQVLNELEVNPGEAHARPSEAEIKRAAARPAPDIDVCCQARIVQLLTHVALSEGICFDDNGKHKQEDTSA